MKKTTLVLTFVFILFSSLSLGVQLISIAKANPISTISVPSIQISYPVTSTGGYVNSTVEFVIYVNLFIESPTINSISYSLDEEASVNREDLKVTNSHDYGPDKIDFKTYKTNIILKDLSEGDHTLVAYANDMSASTNFTVNSHYHVTALNVLSPNSLIYSKNVPLTFTFTGEIVNAHYYLYKGHELVSEKSVSGDMTLDNLSDGSYELYLFVTTEYGQDSKMIPFIVIGISTIVCATILLVFSIAIGSLVYFRKFKRKKLSEYSN